MSNNKKELRALLRTKIEEKRINRLNKECKESIFRNTLKKMGIDKDRLVKDMEDLQKEGGNFNVNLKNSLDK